MTHLTIISHFHTMTKLIFYGTTQFYSQTTFPKNWILCLFILWIICWNRFQNRFGLDFSVNWKRKTYRPTVLELDRTSELSHSNFLILCLTKLRSTEEKGTCLNLVGLVSFTFFFFLRHSWFLQQEEISQLHNLKEHFIWNVLFLPKTGGYQPPDFIL